MTTPSNGNIFRVTDLCKGNPLVNGGFSFQRPIKRSFDVFFDLRLNKLLSKQSRRRWFETPSRSLKRLCDALFESGMAYITDGYTLLAKKVVTPPLKTIKPMWIELLCFHLAEIGMIWTRDCSPTKSDTTLGRHSMQGQVGSSSSETTV